MQHEAWFPLSPRTSPASNPSMRRRHCLLAAGVVSLLGALRAQAQPASAAAEEAQAPALPALGSLFHLPPITLLDGTVFDSSSRSGQPLLVYWWSSTCPFCALQSPSMDKLWRSQQPKGLRMVALSIDRKPEDAAAYLRKKGYAFPAAWASPAWRQGFPKPKGLPITLLSGRDGRLVLAEKGQMFAEDVEAIAGLI